MPQFNLPKQYFICGYCTVPVKYDSAIRIRACGPCRKTFCREKCMDDHAKQKHTRAYYRMLHKVCETLAKADYEREQNARPK